MRRLLILLSVVAIATASAVALALSAGPSGAGAGITGYTVYFPPGAGDAVDDTAAPPVFDPSDGVGAQQGGCPGQLATVDLVTGEVTPLSAAPSTTACAGDLAFAPDGTLYGLVQSFDGSPVAELVRFDPGTGVAAPVDEFGPFQFSIGGAGFGPLGGITFDATGSLYALLGHEDEPGFDPQCAPSGSVGITWCLYRVTDPNTPGESTFVGTSLEAGLFAANLAASCDAIYTSYFTPSSTASTVATVSSTTGEATDVGALDGDRFLFGADFDQTGTFWGVVLDNKFQPAPFFLATLDPAGGTPIETPGPPMTVTGDDEPLLDAIAVEPLDCAQPEPAPIVLEPTFTG